MPHNEFVIPQGVRTVADILERGGFEAWLVGGCVRDHLLGRLPKDYDIATNASVHQTIAAFDGFRVIETGVKHGTVTILSDGMPIEVTTFRIDGSYSDGRHPDNVSFTPDIREDLSRRDFTINAIAYSPERGYTDLFGGVNDLDARIIRCVGDPSKRFHEDALRILRALRFASVLGFEIEPETARAVHECRGLLSRIALERITQELFGILCGDKAADVLRAFPDVIEQILPPCGEMVGFEQHNPHHDCDVWEHTLRVVDACPKERVLRLAALLHDVGKPGCFTKDENGVGHFYGHAARGGEIAQGIFRECLRTDKQTSEQVIALVASHDEPLPPERKIIRRRLAKYGEELLRQLIALNRADMMGQATRERLPELDEAESILDSLVEENACISMKSLAVKGGDLMSMGIPKGPLIGRILTALLSEVCSERLENTPDALRERAMQLYQQYK